jgi:hypothetical protein
MPILPPNLHYSDPGHRINLAILASCGSGR